MTVGRATAGASESVADGLNVEQLVARISFEDTAALERTALRLRVGPETQHRDLTYAELASATRSTAGALALQGCESGQRVALLLPHSEPLVTTFLAALYAGLIPSIVAWPTTKMDEAKYRRNLLAVVQSLDADWLVTEASMLERLGSALGRARVIDPAALSAQPLSRASVRSEGTAFIQFSGGTTGTQKSVPISLQKLQRQLENYAAVLELTQRDSVVSWLPLYHDMGLVACLLLPIVFRLPVIMFSPIEWVMDPRPFMRAVTEHKPTLCWLPNFAFSFLATRCAAPAGSYDLASLRAVINCSEPVRAESLDAFVQRFAGDGLRASACATCYAMAEATFAVTQSAPGAPPARIRVAREPLTRGELVLDEGGERELVSSGIALPGTELKIVCDDASDAPEHRIGEIRIRSQSMMDGYLGVARGADQPPVSVDGWYQSGDLGAIVEGQLFVTGRKKDLVIVGGVNVYPEDIEAAVSELDGIHAGRVVAMGIADEKLGTERLVVVAEVSDPAALEHAAAFDAEVRKTVLAIAGIAPAAVFVVEPRFIVKSTAGKISRSETRQRVRERWDDLLAQKRGQRAEKKA